MKCKKHMQQLCKTYNHSLQHKDSLQVSALLTIAKVCIRGRCMEAMLPLHIQYLLPVGRVTTWNQLYSRSGLYDSVAESGLCYTAAAYQTWSQPPASWKLRATSVPISASDQVMMVSSAALLRSC